MTTSSCVHVDTKRSVDPRYVAVGDFLVLCRRRNRWYRNGEDLIGIGWTKQPSVFLLWTGIDSIIPPNSSEVAGYKLSLFDRLKN